MSVNAAVLADRSSHDFVPVVSRAAFNGGFYALTALIVPITTPYTALLFGVGSSLARTVLRQLLDKDSSSAFNNAMAKSIFVYGAAAAAGLLAVNLVGYSIAVVAAVELTGLLWAVDYINCIGDITK